MRTEMNFANTSSSVFFKSSTQHPNWWDATSRHLPPLGVFHYAASSRIPQIRYQPVHRLCCSLPPSCPWNDKLSPVAHLLLQLWHLASCASSITVNSHFRASCQSRGTPVFLSPTLCLFKLSTARINLWQGGIKTLQPERQMLRNTGRLQRLLCQLDNQPRIYFPPNDEEPD